jgi:hypothetical protein
MLIESEHSMAREDRDGSATKMGFITFASCLSWKSDLRVRETTNRHSRFWLKAGVHKRIKDAIVVAFRPIVHNSGIHDEVQNLGLTPPNHGQTASRQE